MQVIVYDNSCGFYWRKDGAGYTAAPQLAGIYEEDRAPKSDKDRKFQYYPVPEDHVELLKAEILKLQGTIAYLNNMLNSYIMRKDDAILHS